MTDCGKSICFLITGLNVGGAEVQVVSVAKRLRSLGWDPSVVSMLPANGRLADELGSHDVEVYSLNMRQGIPDPSAIFRLVAILRRLRPVILHSHMVHANLLARIVKLFWRGPKVVCTIHSGNECGWFRQLAYRATDAIPELTSTVSRAMGIRYVQSRAVSSSKMRVLPNGVDTARFCPDLQARTATRTSLRLDSQFTWLAVGRFELPKDYPNMLRAFSQLRHPNTVLLIAGVGPLQAKAESLIQELGIGDRVRLLGLRSDIPELMNAADAYVMSSQWEGLPMVLLEAAATGLLIVSTRVGGTGEVVLDGKTGVLVDPQDSGALAAGMEYLMDIDGGQSLEMRQAAREHILENYSLDAIVTLWESIYRNLLAVKEPDCACNETILKSNQSAPPQ